MILISSSLLLSGESKEERGDILSAKDTWEFEIKRHCMDNNGMQVCRFPFSMSYGNKEYEVKEDSVLDPRNDEYLEITLEGGKFSGKRILWSTITSIDSVD